MVIDIVVSAILLAILLLILVIAIGIAAPRLVWLLVIVFLLLVFASDTPGYVTWGALITVGLLAYWQFEVWQNRPGTHGG